MVNAILTNDHEPTESATPESQEARLKRIIGAVMRKANIRELTLSEDEISYSMPPSMDPDGLGNTRLGMGS